MRKGLIVLLVIGLVLIAIGGTFVGRYNTLIELEANVDASWSQVENQLQRRADLIPNLVATVKGYASHEQETFTEIANARSRLLAAQSPEEKLAANQGLDSALGRL